MPDRSQFDSVILNNTNKYIERRLKDCKSEDEIRDVNLFSAILRNVINNTHNLDANNLDVRRIIALLNSDTFWQKSCEVEDCLERRVLGLSIANFKSHIANNFTNDALVQQAANQLCRLIEKDCSTAFASEIDRLDPSNIEKTKSKYYLAIHAMEASHQYAVNNQKSSNPIQRRYFTDYTDLNSDYSKLIDRIQGTPKANAFLENLGVALAVFGAALLISPFVILSAAVLLPPLSILTVGIIIAGGIGGGIGSLMTGSYLCNKYKQHAWSQGMGLFSQAIIANKQKALKNTA